LPEGIAQTWMIPSEIFISYAIDFAGPFNKSGDFNFILVIVNHLSGYVRLLLT
ncbi:hypothetical protein L873DRAFT_1578121, partial [Choiromyces venosus 120613-1]